MSETTNEILLEVENSFSELTQKLVSEGIDPFCCAAVMTKIAFMIYKSSLSAKEYDLMIDAISLNRDRVKTFSEENKHTGNLH